MPMLKFLLTRYARPFYKILGLAAVVGAVVLAALSPTGYLASALIVLGAAAGAVIALAVTIGVLVLNVAVAASLKRGFDRFEAAYDTYRKANNIADIFYEEMDLAEAAARNAEA